jgi:hypothetical protein
MYWANIPVNSTSNDKTTPTFANTTVNGKLLITTSVSAASEGASALQINNTGTYAGPRLINAYSPNLPVSSSEANGVHLMFGVTEASYNAAYIKFWYAGAGSTNNAIRFGFHTSDNLMAILANGNVGIGTTSPSYLLHVNGEARFSDILANYYRYTHWGGNLSHANGNAWYNIYSSTVNTAGDNITLKLSHSYYYTQTDSVIFAINVGYGTGSITQLNSTGGSKIFKKIRVRFVNSATVYVDVQIYSNVANTDSIYVTGTGSGTFRAPTATSDTAGIVKEIDVFYNGFYAPSAKVDVF